MGTVNGNVTLRAGSEDPITLQLLDDDGTTPIDLTGASVVTMHLRNTATQVVTILTGASLVVSDAGLGKITLSQVAAVFPDQANYEYYISFSQDGKARKVPEDINYSWIVTDDWN